MLCVLPTDMHSSPCHLPASPSQHQINNGRGTLPSAPYSASPVPSSARRPPSNTHSPSSTTPLLPPHTPAHPTLHPPPAVDTRAPVFQVEPRPPTPPAPPQPSVRMRRTSSRVTSVVMHVNTSVSLAVCPRGVAAATHDFRHVPACGCHRLHRHPERLSKVGFSCSVAGRCSPSLPTSSPRTPPPRYLLAEFWLERQRKVGC